MFASAELLELPKNVKFGGGLDQNIKDPGVYFFGDSFKDG